MKVGDVIQVRRYIVRDGHVTPETSVTDATVTKIGRTYLYVRFENGEFGKLEKSEYASQNETSK